MRRARRSVSPADAADAAKRVALEATPLIQPGSDVASYVDFDGELQTAILHDTIARSGARLWLPCVDDKIVGNNMEFRRADGPLRRNRFGIPEPQEGTSIDPGDLDLVFVPLTAFNAKGFRLGMGGGYYDRCFAFRRGRSGSPILVGVGYGFQQQESIQTQLHDVPLDLMISEQGLVRFRSVP